MAVASTRTPTENDDGRARFCRADTVVLALLLAWVAACFGQTLGFGFVNWDDFDFVLKNPLVVAPGSVPWFHHLTTPEVGYPFPVTLLSYRVEHALVGFDRPWVQHAVNVALHLGNVALVYVLARRLRLDTAMAALAAVGFGLHPVVSEPVAWVTGRKDLLALGFGLGAVLLALGTPTGSRRWARTACFLLAVLSKPVALGLLPVLVLLAANAEQGQGGAGRVGRALRASWAEVAIVAVYLPVTWLGYRAFGAARVDEAFAASLRSAWYGLGVHMALVLGLEPPSVQHLTPSFPPPFSARFDLLPLGIAALVALVLWRLPQRSRRTVAGALACAVFAYLPSSGVVPIKRFLADSYVYPVLPAVAIAFAVCVQAALARWPSRWAPRMFVPGIALMLGLLVIPAAGRFRSTAELWADAMERYPDSWRMCRNWAVAMQELGGPAKTLAATDQCIARFGAANFEKNRAMALYQLGRAPEAAAWMRQALVRDPADRNVPSGLLELAIGAGRP